MSEGKIVSALASVSTCAYKYAQPSQLFLPASFSAMTRAFWRLLGLRACTVISPYVIGMKLSVCSNREIHDHQEKQNVAKSLVLHVQSPENKSSYTHVPTYNSRTTWRLELTASCRAAALVSCVEHPTGIGCCRSQKRTRWHTSSRWKDRSFQKLGGATM